MRLLMILLSAAALAASGPASAAAGKATEARIAQAFQKLGMKPKKSACYGRILASRLGPADSVKAARILETSKDGDEVRAKVTRARGPVRGAFMSAKANCGFE